MYLRPYIYGILLLLLHLQSISAASIRLYIQRPQPTRTQQLKEQQQLELDFNTIIYDIHVNKVMRSHPLMKAFEWDMDRGREFAKHEWQRMWSRIKRKRTKAEMQWEEEEKEAKRVAEELNAQREREEAEARLDEEEASIKKAEKELKNDGLLYEDTDEKDEEDDNSDK